MSPAIHLNLLNPLERKSSSPVRGKFMLAFAAGFVFSVELLIAATFAVLWAISIGQIGSIDGVLAKHKQESAKNDALKRKYVNVQAETDQFDYYLHGRQTRGNLLRLIALAVPEGVTLTLLEIPEPGDQGLYPKRGVKAPPLQGPKETTERVELRLAGLARAEEDVFRLMDTLKGPAFTNDLVLAENPIQAADKSPRVVAFRQETSANGGRSGVFFDVVYQVKPREFSK